MSMVRLIAMLPKRYYMIGIKKQQPGFTLMELVVSVAIFTVIMLGSTRAFQFVIEGQRSALASYQVQESLKYFFEVMSKEARMVRLEALDCYSGAAAGDLFAVNPTGRELYFKNYNDKCVKYYVDNGRFMIERGSKSGYITPSNVFVTSVNFSVADDIVDLPATGDVQPSIIVNLKAKYTKYNKAMHEGEMILQTTISARYYE